ncbi:MAG: hypothetical protein LIP12_08370 [Clostridiales bacterium]|nr:hypothetical protein [Clostridiales bacterium]
MAIICGRKKVERLIEKFDDHMDREQYADAKEDLAQLISILGEDPPKAIALKSEYVIGENNGQRNSNEKR